MDKLLEGAVQQVPGLVVLAVIVILFLKAIGKIVTNFLDHMQMRDTTLKELHDDHMKAREESREALKTVAGSLSSMSEILHEMKEVVRGCPKR